jgi:hypothetical protein
LFFVSQCGNMCTVTGVTLQLRLGPPVEFGRVVSLLGPELRSDRTLHFTLPLQITFTFHPVQRASLSFALCRFHSPTDTLALPSVSSVSLSLPQHG